jgi:murein L,D-transpeptidase YcbB/YkuD
MKKHIGFKALACLLALAASAPAIAQEPAKTRNSGFFERLFSGSERLDADGQPLRRKLFGRRADEENVAGNVPRKTRRATASIPDEDPEGDPGLGLGNLVYVPPKLLPLSGLTLDAPRPADTAAAQIHDQLTAEGPALRLLPGARDTLVAHYVAQGFKPVWLENGTLGVRGMDVLNLLSTADQDGLDPASYLPTPLASFSAPIPDNDPAAMARLDIDLSAAALRYARDASGGQFDPRRLSRYNDITPGWIEAPQALKVIAWSPFAAEYLKTLHPTHPAYAAMKKALAEQRAAEAGSTEDEPIAGGKIIRPGEIDPRIPLIRRRLAGLGYPSVPENEAGDSLLDLALTEQLKLFQKAAGIKMTGAVGPQTLEALNGDGNRSDSEKLLDNMERLRWLPRNLGPRYVFVNQPAFTAEVIENGRPVWQTRVIVGKPNTQTAAFHDEMELVVFNPSWGVPPSIIANEYLPKLRRDPGYLDRIGFKVVNQQGKVVPSKSISWANYGKKVPYGIHQPPGADNALGEIKFLFPNSHNIYMHDTPSRDLFARDVRAFSHGCVRVQNPRDFAAVVLGWSPEDVAKRITSKRSETIRLKTKIPVHITYFTAWPDESGNIQFFNDIYGRDRAMETARSAIVLARN